MKDKHNVILILVLSKWLIPYSGGTSNSCFHLFIFLYRSAKFSLYLVAKVHLIIARFHLVFFNLSFLSFDHSFITEVLHGGSTWWFMKDLIPSRSVHQDSFHRSSRILHLVIRSAILSTISFEVALCHSW